MNKLASFSIGAAAALGGLYYFALAGSFAGKCPTDAQVIEWFEANKKTLEELLNMEVTDDGKVTYVGHGVVELWAGTSLPEARKQEYLRKFQETGAQSFIYQRNEGATVSLWTDARSAIPSITDSCRYKDVEYIEDINKWHYKELLRPSLDGLEKGKDDTIWLRHIEGNWYIVFTKG